MISINGCTYELEATTTLSAIEQEILAAATTGPAFVRFRLANGGAVAALVDARAAVTVLDLPASAVIDTDDPRVLWEHHEQGQAKASGSEGGR